MDDDFNYITRGVSGSAEPAEVKDVADFAAEGRQSDWKDWCEATIERVLKIAMNERSRALVKEGKFFDGDHGSIFVLAVLAIFSELKGRDQPGHDYYDCAMHFISMDPISTFFILLDPGRDEPNAMNRIIKRGLGKMEYLSRAEADRKYKDLYDAACKSCNCCGYVNDLMGLKRGIERKGDENMIVALKRHINAVYRRVADDSVKIYNHVLREVRERMKRYDWLRYIVACEYPVLFPSSEPHATMAAHVSPRPFNDALNSIKAMASKILLGRGQDDIFDHEIEDHNDLMCLAQFIRSDYFVYLPLCPKCRETYNRHRDADKTLVEIMGKKEMAPVAVMSDICADFEKRF